MKEKPILFSTPMVQAILDGRKTQTRRIFKVRNQIVNHPNEWVNYDYEIQEAVYCSSGGQSWYKCPYGEVGDVLWVRETWHPKRHNMPTGWPYEYKATALQDGTPIDEKWKPSIHMPREAGRLFLEITNIRVERLQDISEKDIASEGVRIPVNGIGTNRVLFELGGKNKAIDFLPKGCFAQGAPKLTQSQILYAFWAELWCKINGFESWQSNPFVWVIEFKRIER